MAITAQEHLLDLVALPSVSSMSNRAVIDYARRQLADEVWRVREFPYFDADGLEKVNLIASVGAGRPELALVCHTDTVPFDPAWNEAVKPVVRDGLLYGRGSCDVKSFLACVLDAVTQVQLQELRLPLALILTADEEIGCVGAKHLAELKQIQARYMVIGEPTGLCPSYAGKGYGLAEIVVHGQEAHSAFPARGCSAIRDAARVMERLDAVSAELASFENREFDPPYTTLNVGLIHGGTAKNIVPGECRLTLEWRSVPGQPAETAIGLVRRELAGLPVDVNVKRLDLPFEASRTQALRDRVAAFSGRQPATLSFGTEAGTFRPFAEEVIVFGPGDMTTAHKTGEHVPLEELNRCAAILQTLIRELCGGE